MNMIMLARTPRHASRGVTLIELMITLVILAILATIGVPSMVGLIRDARLSSYTDLLVNTLNLARIEAIKQRKNMKVCTAADPNHAAATCAEGTTDWSNGAMIVDFDGRVIRREPFQGGVTVTTSARPVNFIATVGSHQNPQTFTLCIEGRPRQQVNIFPSGHVSKTIMSVTGCP